MKSGELFDKRRFPKPTKDAFRDIENLRQWMFEFADKVEQHFIKQEKTEEAEE